MDKLVVEQNFYAVHTDNSPNSILWNWARLAFPNKPIVVCSDLRRHVYPCNSLFVRKKIHEAYAVHLRQLELYCRPNTVCYFSGKRLNLFCCKKGFIESCLPVGLPSVPLSLGTIKILHVLNALKETSAFHPYRSYFL